MRQKRKVRKHHAILHKEQLLSVLTLVSMLLGILTGIVFGDRCSIFAPAGKFFIALMQASALPYLFFSVLYSFGSLDKNSMASIWKSLLCALLVVFVPTALLCIGIPSAFPDWLHTPLFHIGEGDAAKKPFPITMFIANPVTAMANNYIPALALFCLITGFILQRTTHKIIAMRVMKTSQDVLIDFSRFCGYLVPICIYAMLANVTGCLSFAELFQYRVYVLSYLAMSLFFFFVMLPLLLKIFYPFRYTDIFRTMRFPCMTALLTGNNFIVLPATNEGLADLFEKYGFDRQKVYQYSAVLIPIFYLFPCASRVTDTIFISFAAWQNNIVFSITDLIRLYAIDVLVGFGSTRIGLPFMLQCFRLPQNVFGIYLFADFILFTYLKAAFNLLGYFCATAISVLLLEKVRLRLRRSAVWAVSLSLSGVAFVFGLKFFWSLQTRPENEKKIVEAMKVKEKIPWVLCRELPREPRPAGRLFEHILETRTLRVGIVPKAMPSCYLDRNGNPAGLDIQLIQLIASGLDCAKIEYYILDYPDVFVALEKRLFDLVAGHLYVTPKRLEEILFSRPYLQVPMAFMAPRDRIQILRDNPARLTGDGIRVGVINDEEIPMLRRRGVKAQVCNLGAYAKYIEDDTACDLMCVSADVAAVYCALHPEFDYYISPGMYENVIAFALPPQEYRLAHFVDYSLAILEKDGELKKWQRYWISGENVISAPRHKAVIDRFLTGADNVHKFMPK